MAEAFNLHREKSFLILHRATSCRTVIRAEKNMIKLYSPQTEVDLAIIRSILGGDDVKYFIHNDHFGSLRIGPSIKLYNVKTIMVSEKDYDRAAELVSDYIENTKPQNTDPKEFKSEYSFFDKIRIIIETILFGWTVPGKMKKIGNQKKNDRILVPLHLR